MAARPASTQVLRAFLRQRQTVLNGRKYSTARATSEQTSPLIYRSDITVPGNGHIRVLELNRPGARNALSKSLLSALSREIADVQGQYTSMGDEIPLGETIGSNRKGYTRALVLTSAIDESFCAGADLKERKGMTKEETKAFLNKLRNTLTLLSSLQIPTISAISSLALGGGLELALSTTFRVLASTASVGLPETRLGIIPGAGGTYRLPALIGVGRARDMILTGRRVSAAEAYFTGIADRLVEVLPDEDEDTKKLSDTAQGSLLLGKARKAALSEAVRMAEQICEGGPIAVRAGLQAVNYAREEVENQMYERVFDCEDKYEALAAFQEKRKPVFTGR